MHLVDLHELTSRWGRIWTGPPGPDSHACHVHCSTVVCLTERRRQANYLCCGQRFYYREWTCKTCGDNKSQRYNVLSSVLQHKNSSLLATTYCPAGTTHPCNNHTTHRPQNYNMLPSRCHHAMHPCNNHTTHQSQNYSMLQQPHNSSATKLQHVAQLAPYITATTTQVIGNKTRTVTAAAAAFTKITFSDNISYNKIQRENPLNSRRPRTMLLPSLRIYLRLCVTLIFDLLTPKLITSSPCSVDHLCQLASCHSKLVHTLLSHSAMPQHDLGGIGSAICPSICPSQVELSSD